MQDLIAPLPTLLSAGAILLLLLAALHDIAARTIPDAVSAALLAGGIGLRLLAGDLAWGLLAGGLVFALAAFAWRRGWMGGGDVKLLGATAVLLSPATVPDFLLTVALAGGVVALLYLSLRRLVPLPSGPRPDGLLRRSLRAEAWRIRRGGPLPYAVAIAGGALITLAA